MVKPGNADDRRADGPIGWATLLQMHAACVCAQSQMGSCCTHMADDPARREGTFTELCGHRGWRALWAQVHNPVAPTGELLAALAGMGGPVSHIVVPNGSPEHWCVDVQAGN
jgi:hypothetical protein